MPKSTLVVRIQRWFQNNRFTAPLIVAATVVATLLGIWNGLPQEWRSGITAIFAGDQVDNGWIPLGYLDATNPTKWNEGPYAHVIGTPSETPLEPFRKGDLIVLNRDREIIILDYQKFGTKKAYIAPPVEHGILRSEDHTKSVIKTGTKLIVRDLWVGGFPNADYVVWVRVVPEGTAN